MMFRFAPERVFQSSSRETLPRTACRVGIVRVEESGVKMGQAKMKEAAAMAAFSPP
jgi:hypothetical protein